VFALACAGDDVRVSIMVLRGGRGSAHTSRLSSGRGGLTALSRVRAHTTHARQPPTCCMPVGEGGAGTGATRRLGCGRRASGTLQEGKGQGWGFGYREKARA